MIRSSASAPDPFWAYFLDIDGTLVGLADTPWEVKVDGKFRAVVEALHRNTGGAVALITGRGIADVDRLFPGTQFPVAGQHGVERRGPSGQITRHRFPHRDLDRVRARLRGVTSRHTGLILEDKGLSLALHYRRNPALAGYSHRLVRSLAKTLGPAFGVQSGKRVVEIRPTGQDKGSAIQAFLKEPPFRGRTPVFIGDDVTDEPGFAMVNQLKGYSVKVGLGATMARWRFHDVKAVRTWLQHGRPRPTVVRQTRPVGRGHARNPGRDG